MKIIRKIIDWLLRSNAETSEPSKSPDWMDEKNFWFKKADRAFTRYLDACERGDEEAKKLSEQQHSLYKRRYDAVPVPEDVLRQNEKRRREEKQAALNEMQ